MRSIQDQYNKKTGVFLSGGLVSTAIAVYLSSRGCTVHAFWADVGQEDEPRLERLLGQLAERGIAVSKIDLRKEIGGHALDMLKYNASYEGGYWNSTGGLRYVLVKELAPYFLAAECEVFTHGCVGGGNDQRRFSRYGRKYLSGLEEFLPWETVEIARDLRGRRDMYEFLTSEGIDVFPDSKISQSTDSCVIGTSHEGTEIEGMGDDYTHIEPLMSVMPWNAAEEQVRLTVSIAGGRVCGINGDANAPFALLDMANKIGGKAGVSLRSVLENRITDTKCRGVYESPGMDLLSFAYGRLLQATLSRNAASLMNHLSRLIGAAVYEGRYADPEIVAARAACDAIVNHLRGEMTCSIYKGNLYCTKLELPDRNAGVVYQRRFSDGGHVWVDKLVS
ncbi:MAG TPA: argininosuccinate synthase domain-containing protein [Puia sp.]|jgi:argininosuccinate synthase|nr:argininosuccinate synthase domain-containing protein [Puia sp.]